MKKKEVALAIFLLTGLTLQAQERVTQSATLLRFVHLS